MPKVCHVIFNHHPFDGRVFYKEALSLQRHGYDLAVAVPQLTRYSLGRRKDVTVEAAGEYRFEGVRFIPYSYKRKLPKLFNIRMRWCVRSLLRALVRADADIYHFHEDGPVMEAAVILKRRFPGKKIVFDYHESFLHQCRENRHKLARVNRLVLDENELLKSGDLFITVSEFISDYYRTLTDKPVVTVMNCQSESLFRSPDTVKGDSGMFYVVHEGGLTFDRGLELIVETARHIRNPLIKILIIGAMPKRETRFFEQRTQQYGIKDRFVLTGQLPYKDVPGWMAAAKLGIDFRTSINAQTGIANKFFNYIRFGIPILALPNCITDPFITGYEIGRIVDPQKPSEIADYIEGLCHDTEAYRRMRNNTVNAFKTAFNWELMEKRLLQAYARLLEN